LNVFYCEKVTVVILESIPGLEGTSRKLG
jgi:hypothetical protein